MLPWRQLPGGQVVVSHPAGSEQGDEVKVRGPRVRRAPLALASGQVPAFWLHVFTFLLQADPSLRSHQQGRSICSPTAIKNIQHFLQGQARASGAERRTQRRPMLK